MSSANILEVENLSKSYSGHTAVDSISFQIKRGEIVGFLGPNGAGKSTTMRIISTFQPATSGSVRVAGHDVFYQPTAAQKAIGYMPEHNPLPLELRVREYLQFRARLRQMKNRPRLDEVTDQCGLKSVANRIIGQLSKGYRQRVGLADALLHEPELVILDEPTTGLDPNQIRSVRELIRSLAPKMTVLLSTHILPEVALTCDRVIILNQGRILADEATDALQKRFLEYADIVTEISGPSDQVKAALEQLPEVSHLTTQATTDEYIQYTIRGTGNQDLRSKVFEIIHQNGWQLRELRRKDYSLEEIFSRLTETAYAA
jgi:ABC-2 type transport system ATP-binding protein